MAREVPCPPPVRPPSVQRGRVGRCRSVCSLAAPEPVDEEPLRLRRPDLRRRQLGNPARRLARAARRSASSALLSGVVYLINDVRDREADRLHPVKSRRPIASGALSPRRALRPRRSSWRRRRWPRPLLSARRSGSSRRPISLLLGALLRVAQAHGDPRRADDRRRLRAAGGRRRGRRGRRVQPLAAAADAARRAVPGAEQAPRRAGDAGGRRHAGTAGFWPSTARICSTR